MGPLICQSQVRILPRRHFPPRYRLPNELTIDLSHASHSPTCLELLELAAEMWMDESRRLRGICGVAIASTSDGQVLFVGSETPETLVPALVDAVDTSPRASAPDIEHLALVVCREILEPSCAPLSLDAGPYYLIEPVVRIEPRAYITRSDTGPGERLRPFNPGNWGAGEWDELLDGTLGPWAMAVVDGNVVSICHTPGRMTERAAECGVWTHPDYRRRGYAAEVTATWAEILRPSGRHLFYSTDAENLSSQRVATRLELRPIGWTWRLATAKPEQGHPRHPLNRRSS
jgi:ribosomal protein S18 acetylase RimI-like enzyme